MMALLMFKQGNVQRQQDQWHIGSSQQVILRASLA